MQILLSKEAVSQVDLTHLAHFLQWNPVYQQYFVKEVGQEPFKLFAYLSKQIGGVAIDMGTLYGSSALALSYNENTKVVSFDTVRHIPDSQDIVTPLKRPNIKMFVCSCQAVLHYAATADVIVLDIDIRFSQEIRKIINELDYFKFKGILVLDNININDEMKQLWHEVANHHKKLDVTAIGHHTGTGIIVYNPSHIDIDYNFTTY